VRGALWIEENEGELLGSEDASAKSQERKFTFTCNGRKYKRYMQQKASKSAKEQEDGGARGAEKKMRGIRSIR